jgi:hypothetical protein
MTTESVNIYGLTCLEENAFVYPIARTEEQGPPTICPNDHANRSNITNVIKYKTLSSNAVVATQDSEGIFYAKMYSWDLPGTAPGEVSTFTLTWANTIQVWELGIEGTAVNIGDTVTICVAPGAPIGYLTAPVSSGTVLHVPQPTVASSNVLVGSVIVLDDTVNNVQQEVGHLVSKDQDNFQLHVDTAVANSFPAGTVVRQYLYMIREMPILRDERLVIGRKGLSGKRIPANVPVQLTVVNGNGSAKKINIYSEIYRS